MKSVKFSSIKTMLLSDKPNPIRLYLDSIVIENGIMYYSNAVTGIIFRNQIIDDSGEYRVVIPRTAIQTLLKLHKDIDSKIDSNDILYFDNDKITLKGISVSIFDSKYPYTNVYSQFNSYNTFKAKLLGSTAYINPKFLSIVTKAIKLNPDLDNNLCIKVFDNKKDGNSIVQLILSDLEIYILQLKHKEP